LVIDVLELDVLGARREKDREIESKRESKRKLRRNKTSYFTMAI